MKHMWLTLLLCGCGASILPHTDPLQITIAQIGRADLLLADMAPHVEACSAPALRATATCDALVRTWTRVSQTLLMLKRAVALGADADAMGQSVRRLVREAQDLVRALQLPQPSRS